MLYFIVNKTDLTQSMIEYSENEGAFNLRSNIEETKYVLKYQKNKIPLEILNLDLTSYTEEEIKVELDSDEWKKPI